MRMALNSLICADVPLRNCSLTHPYGVVIEVKTTSADRKSMEPVAVVRRCRRQQSGPMIRLTITTEQVIVLHVDDNLVLYFLFVSHGVVWRLCSIVDTGL